MDYRGEPNFQHGEIPAVGILLSNLGTPDAPRTPELRRYLREFLSDPRVIELPRLKWQIILNLFVLTTRPKKSAQAYQTVWTDQGSPLLVISKKQAEGVRERLQKRFGSPIHVALGMRYGNPSLASAVEELTAKGCRRIVHFPLYPQYAAATTASTFDALSTALQKMRWIPELRTINSYVDNPHYIRALANSIREHWEKQGQAEKLLLSFHGIPERYFLGGDPYHCQCHKTARLVAEELGLREDQYQVTFQSRFGKETWLQPYTDETLKAWGKEKLESVDVICPGFSADCLETIEEIGEENREYFEHSGGGRYSYIAALNDRPDHLDALTDVIAQNLGGWATPKEEWDPTKAAEQASMSRKEAERMGCPHRK